MELVSCTLVLRSAKLLPNIIPLFLNSCCCYSLFGSLLTVHSIYLLPFTYCGCGFFSCFFLSGGNERGKKKKKEKKRLKFH